ncbi:hypothetical protein BV25DRAFT_1835902 [Artomyces pyxidatus]|uniref:Uncharacterized protein n=1 Tax=Artomyces pyxidatus TaxID=48021 RepID=A0ACB8TCC9_9AGAM|nr:hypothetical protein BV25DRAFT_1835902 [Artomyces pyxidatus]
MHLFHLVAGSMALFALHAQAMPLSFNQGQALFSYVGGYVKDVFVSLTCPIHDSVSIMDDVSAGELDLIETLAGEEYWFRWEHPDAARSTDILQLDKGKGGKKKDYDDQAYKWISTDHTNPQQTKKGRVPTIHVLPAGTRDALRSAAHRFEDTSKAKQAVDFVTKDHEPGAIGINGIKKTGGKTALDDFRNKVIRTVIKETFTKGGKQTVKHTTIHKGATKPSSGASNEDRERLKGF